MHILTKVFIVLVSLLAVLIVPLVVVYAYNENSFKARYDAEVLQKAAAQQAAQQAQTREAAEVSRRDNDIALLNQELKTLRQATDTEKANVRALESKLAAAEGMKTEISARLSTLATSVEAGQQLTESLVTELRQLRTDAVAIERQKVELDEANRELTGQLEVAVAARRALEEELSRIKDEHAKAMAKLGMAIGMGFNPDKTVVRAGLVPDKTLSARVIRVERSSDKVLVEIDAGSRDGVQKDWKMMIVNGDEFIANIMIINVDINRSTGRVTLENKPVEVGQSAQAVAGME